MHTPYYQIVNHPRLMINLDQCWHHETAKMNDYDDDDDNTMMITRKCY